MALDCVIKFEVRNQGRGSAHTVEGPVSRFLRDDENYYRAVEKHIKSCRRCSPQEALEGFLQNRIDRHRGLASDLIAKMARRWGRAFGERLSPATVREFEVRRFANWSDLRRADYLTPDEVRRAHSIYREAWKRKITSDCKDGDVPRGLNGDWTMMQTAQYRSGWRDEQRIGRDAMVPMDLQFYASLSEADAHELGGLPAAAWTMSRYSLDSMLEDEDEVIRNHAVMVLTREVMGS